MLIALCEIISARFIDDYLRHKTEGFYHFPEEPINTKPLAKHSN